MRAAVLAAVLAGVLAAAVPASATLANGRITVLAAASLTDVFPRIDPKPHYSFGGSDTLAAQIEQGAPADVFASASPTFTERLYREHLVRKPIRFASNRLVVVMPRANPAGIHSVLDLRRRGVKIVIGSASVPIGAYTRRVLARLGIADSVLANVVSEEPDVRSILAKVVLGEADAGFVYVTDAKAASGRVRTVAIPRRGQPTVAYELAVVAATHDRRGAAAFVRTVLSPRGQRVLRAAGFGPRR